MPENIVTATVSFGTNGDTADAYLAHPDSPGLHPSLIVIQDKNGGDWTNISRTLLSGLGA